MAPIVLGSMLWLARALSLLASVCSLVGGPLAIWYWATHATNSLGNIVFGVAGSCLLLA